MNNHIHNQNGLTLIELVVVIAIAGILLAVGVPAMQTFVQNGRITAVTNELLMTLNKAHGAAIGRSACICPSNNVTVAIPACVNSGNWETGWIAFVDFNGNCIIDGVTPTQDVLVRVWDGAPYAGRITVRTNNVNINATNQIRFDAGGESIQNGIRVQGTFRICDQRGLVAANDTSVTAAAVVLNTAGTSFSTRSSTQIGACP